ncbi:MAG: DUF2975 domain-containing protein [Sphingomicrobium sp.]
MARVLSSALPFASILVVIFIVLNILAGVAILALLLLLPNREWIISALGLAGSPDIEKVIWGLRAVAGLGVIAVGFNHLILSRMHAILKTVEVGDPFIAANAFRLQAIAWFLLILQLLSLVIAAIGKTISTTAHPVDLDAGFSPAGWLAVLLTFVLARVFAEGAIMRRELEGTI